MTMKLDLVYMLETLLGLQGGISDNKNYSGFRMKSLKDYDLFVQHNERVRHLFNDDNVLKYHID